MLRRSHHAVHRQPVGYFSVALATADLLMMRARVVTPWWGGTWQSPNFQKKQGATGITTVAPYIAGQWGRGNNRLF